jgi:hypothetical protein
MVSENKNAQVGAWIFEESSENPNHDHGGDFDARTATGGAVTLSNSRSYYGRESVKLSAPESPWSTRKNMHKSALGFSKKAPKIQTTTMAAISTPGRQRAAL